MLQFDEYKVKLNNLKPELDELEQIKKENPTLYERLAADYDIDTWQGALDALNAVNGGEYEENEDEDEEE